MNAATSHPTADAIAAFAHGRLSESDSAEVEAHVTECDSCSRILQQQPHDPLLCLVRQPAAAQADRGTGTAHGDGTMPEKIPAAEAGIPPELVDHPRYRVLKALGQGGMGAVYLAEHLMMRRQVVLKVIRADLLDRPDARSRFEQEVLAAARLAHPNIVQAFDADQAGDLHFL